MTKTYTSKTELSFNVCVDGAWIHVSFVPLTLGGSYLTTSDPHLQAAIERHRFFGRWIAVSEEVAAHAEAPNESPSSPSSPSSLLPELLYFSSLADAKEWMAAEYGISRTLLRTWAQMETVALEHGRKLVIQNPSTSHHYDFLERS